MPRTSQSSVLCRTKARQLRQSAIMKGAMMSVEPIQRMKAAMKGETSPTTPRPKTTLLAKKKGTARKMSQSVRRVCCVAGVFGILHGPG